MARAGGVVLVVQGEMAHPSGGDPVSQRLGQIAAGCHPARRHLHQEPAADRREIGHGGKSSGRVEHEQIYKPSRCRNIEAGVAGGKTHAPAMSNPGYGRKMRHRITHLGGARRGGIRYLICSWDRFALQGDIMCTMAILYRVARGTPILVAANREERFDRPTQYPKIQSGSPRVVCGIDRRAGGTWLGVNQFGLFCAVTNRRKANVPAEPRSRGLLCRELLDLRTARKRPPTPPRRWPRASMRGRITSAPTADTPPWSTAATRWKSSNLRRACTSSPAGT